MRILILGYKDTEIEKFLRNGNAVIWIDEKIDVDFVKKNNIEFIISYGYRHIIKKDIIDLFPNKIINLHISFLPWNKGAHPNIWSFIEDTPKGITIHQIDKEIDAGDILVQQEFDFKDDATLKTTYDFLQREIQWLFINNWEFILNGTPVKQCGVGTFHAVKDFGKIKHLLPNGMDTKIMDIKINKIKDMLKNCWCKETSADPNNWSENNSSYGQCAITTLIVQDVFGGDLMRGLVNDNVSHYWNKINGEEFDLTKEQFNTYELKNEPVIRDREYVLSYPDTKLRYELLKEKYERIKND